jgi:hypothetical protein
MLPTGRKVCIITHSSKIREYIAQLPTTRSQITCFRCGEQGHYKSECFHWKTRHCWHNETGMCKDPNCSFAHGEEELRRPWMPRCIRIVKKDGQLQTLGCKEYGHTFKYCPHNQIGNNSLQCKKAA